MFFGIKILLFFLAEYHKRLPFKNHKNLEMRKMGPKKAILSLGFKASS